MTRTINSLFFMTAIVLSMTFVAALDFAPNAEAVKGQGVSLLKTGSAGSPVCGDRLCSEVEEEAAPEPEKKQEEVKKEKKMKEEKKAEEPIKEEAMEKQKRMDELPPWKTTSGTVTSVQDPGKGHEKHQLAVILPPSDKIYRGWLTYSASEPIQLVALHGPLAPGMDNGQPIWTPDGKTKFALTFVDPETNMGTWRFAGNALAVHTMNEEEFAVSYSLTYRERMPSATAASGTLVSDTDPGVGHETHQLAVILPPSERVYNGQLTYSANEPIQLVALHGPLLPGQDKGQPIWTPDGETKFALTFVDPGTSMGSWTFSGNAIAVHTMNETPFTVSYSVASGQ